ncbi:MAG: hypothetical protein RBS07_16685 [Lentimicrobium sp.]|jgi:hypothetical protein|nr:hypothetical protein [Lentimicrobium sp.]
MKTVIKSESDNNMEQKLRSYLRRTGRLVPETPAEVENLLQLMPELSQPQGTFEEAMEVIKNGFLHFRFPEQEPLASELTIQYHAAAARNAGKLSDEVRQLMDSDREQTMNAPDEDETTPE